MADLLRVARRAFVAGVSAGAPLLQTGDGQIQRVLPEARASFAPEAAVHRFLLDRGVSVPAVVHYAHYNEVLGCSVMMTGEIAVLSC
jgi:hypothetical protein